MSEPITEPIKCELKIINKRGLHARASAKFVQTVEDYKASIHVSKDGQTVCGSSIMGLMMLGASPGCQIVVEAIGDDASEAIDAIRALVSNGFGEE